MFVVSELLALNRLRLERDLTYERLGQLVGVTPQTIYRLLTVPNARLHDRTLFKIQRFLEKQRSTEAA